MSQEYAVCSYPTYGNGGHSPDNVRREIVERVNGNGTMETIRFEIPALGTINSSTARTRSRLDCESSKDNEDQFVV